MRKTKIVATLGPATDNPQVMKDIIKAGINVARMNFSHGSHEEHKERLEKFKKACNDMNVSLPVLLDTKGPEIRTGEFKDKVLLKTDTDFTIYHEDVVGDEKGCSLSYKELYKDVKVGDNILFDDGLVRANITAISGKDINCKICNDGYVSTKKSVNVPNVSVQLPPLTEKDINDLKFACENDYDFIAMSFVRKASDVITAREHLKKFGGKDIQIIAKIENREGVDNIDDIIAVADGIMVARGDLGVEIPFEQVPSVQYELIQKCYKKGKNVITATQMLDSMMRNPRPTRAEVSDISTAVFQGTSAVMLSGETAIGKYPVESVTTMANVAVESEKSIKYWLKLRRYVPETIPMSVTDGISYSTCTTAMNLNAKAIITVTTSGKTARMISRLHPDCPIIAVTPTKKVHRQMQLCFGVHPMLSTQQTSTDELIRDGINNSLKSGLVNPGEMVIITAGIPIGTSGTTNLLKAEIVGDIAAHGLGIGSGTYTGKLRMCTATDYNVEEGDIMVAKYTIHDMLPGMKQCSAIIVEDFDMNSHAAITAMALEIPIIIGVDNACNLLTNGATATLDINAGTIQYTSF